jgi:hypothetical protein
MYHHIFAPYFYVRHDFIESIVLVEPDPNIRTLVNRNHPFSDRESGFGMKEEFCESIKGSLEED